MTEQEWLDTAWMNRSSKRSYYPDSAFQKTHQSEGYVFEQTILDFALWRIHCLRAHECPGIFKVTTKTDPLKGVKELSSMGLRLVEMYYIEAGLFLYFQSDMFSSIAKS